MLFSNLNRTLPTYIVSEMMRETVTTGESFGTSSVRDDWERNKDQNQGRTAEYVFAKHLDDNYDSDDWLWLDDMSSASFKHDFLLRTDEGWATIDVKSRRVNGTNSQSGIPAGYQKDPDFFGRNNVNRNSIQTHIDNHVYAMVALHDDADIDSEAPYRSGTIAGIATAKQIANAPEYKHNPDNGIYKPCISSSDLNAVSDLDTIASNSILDVRDNGGFPSVADKIVNEEHSNIKDEYKNKIESDESNFEPKKLDTMNDNGSMNRDKFDSTVDTDIFVVDYEPMMMDMDYEKDVDKAQELQQYYFDKYGSFNLTKTQGVLNYISKKENPEEIIDNIVDEYGELTYSTITYDWVDMVHRKRTKGELIDAIPHEEYGTVYIREVPCGKSNCPTCPHGPYLYTTSGKYLGKP